MTRTGILSDVHGDAAALDEALAHLDRLGADIVLWAGDLVDFGDSSCEVVARLRDQGVLCVRGNHDRRAVAQPESRELQAGAIEFLRSLPFSWSRTIDGLTISMFHASPAADTDGFLPDQILTEDFDSNLARSRADVLIVGHTHNPFEMHGTAGRIVNPGSLLRTMSAAEEGDTRLYDRVLRLQL